MLHPPQPGDRRPCARQPRGRRGPGLIAATVVGVAVVVTGSSAWRRAPVRSAWRSSSAAGARAYSRGILRVPLR